ncbi:MAG: hypothetical protein RMY29_013895 [Nostoc sp. CreGUA01]|nr:hypothetical protein [Nostoc sp. CreGUA01]
MLSIYSRVTKVQISTSPNTRVTLDEIAEQTVFYVLNFTYFLVIIAQHCFGQNLNSLVNHHTVTT